MSKKDLSKNEINPNEKYVSKSQSQNPDINVSMIGANHSLSSALAIVPALITNNLSKRSLMINCLLDSGANFSVLAQKAANRLRLKGKKIETYFYI